MKKIISLLVVIFLLNCFSLVAFAGSNEAVESKIDNIEGFKDSLKIALSDNIVTDKEKAALYNNTETHIVNQFIEEKANLAMQEINKMNCQMELKDEDAACFSQKVDLGDGCWVLVTVTDQKEESVDTKNTDTVKETNSSKNSGYSTVWKAYGNRYYKAQTTYFFGVAWGKMGLENHYKLDSSGITERYGTPYCSDTGLMRVSSNGDCTITDYYARTIGASDVNMYSTFHVIYGYDPILWSKTYKMATTIKYLDKDTINGEIKVGQSFNCYVL